MLNDYCAEKYKCMATGKITRNGLHPNCADLSADSAQKAPLKTNLVNTARTKPRQSTVDDGAQVRKASGAAARRYLLLDVKVRLVSRRGFRKFSANHISLKSSPVGKFTSVPG